MSRELGLEKISFMGYSDPEFKNLKNEVRAQINPSTFTRTLTVSMNKDEKVSKRKASGTDPAAGAESYSFDLLIDGTGAVDDTTGTMSINDVPMGISTEIDDFLETVYLSEDEPTYVKMYYCGMEYKCMLSSLTITYSLFHRNGAPMRAKLTCKFTSLEKPKLEDKPVNETQMNTGSNTTIDLYKDCDGNAYLMVQQAYELDNDFMI